MKANILYNRITEGSPVMGKGEEVILIGQLGERKKIILMQPIESLIKFLLNGEK